MPAKSTHVIVVNSTGEQFSKQSASLDHGIWSQQPSDVIPTGGIGEWQSESNGFATGTEGTAKFTVSGNAGRVVSIRWDNPFAGGNEYEVKVPNDLVWKQVQGSGDNAVVIFLISENGVLFLALEACS